MSDPITSTIAQLLFRGTPPLDFPNLVDDLRTSLMEGPTGACKLHWDHDDVAIFTLDNARIILGWTQSLPGRYAACLTIGVGATESGNCRLGIASHQGTITRLLAERINARYMSDRMLWKTSGQSPTATMVDAMIEELPGVDPAWSGAHADMTEFDRMLARFDAETAEQISELAPEVPQRQTRPRRPQAPSYRTERPKVQPRPNLALPANDTPAIAQSSIEETQRIRAALAETEQEAQASGAPRKLFGLPLWRKRGGGSALVAASIALTLGSQLLQPALAAVGY